MNLAGNIKVGSLSCSKKVLWWYVGKVFFEFFLEITNEFSIETWT